MSEFLVQFLEAFSIWYVIAGAGVGFAVGVTGVGGGSLMTPLLLMFGFPAATAIGTDLLYASITKANGILAYHRQKAVNWKVMGYMSAGSLPAAAVTVWALHNYFPSADAYQHLLTTLLGIMLTLTAIVIFMRGKIQKRNIDVQLHPEKHRFYRHPYLWTAITGVLLGVLVTLSSIGAGVIGTAVLMLLYPKWNSVQIVGTDLAHAVPLTLVAGIGHLFLGHVDWMLLLALLIGSLPAIYVGSRVASKLPDRLLQMILACVLAILGVKYAFF